MKTLTLPKIPRTAMDIYEMLPEGTLCEVINNTLYMAPSPNFTHQDTSSDLFLEIANHVKENKMGKAWAAPIGVWLDGKNAVEPDIVFLSNSNFEIIQTKGIVGTPDLIVEILSPGNNKHDTVKKKNLYEKFGVKEYWIVEPETKAVIGYELVSKKFKPFPSAKAIIKSKLLKANFKF